jgi:RNA-directed DNA polymerase
MSTTASQPVHEWKDLPWKEFERQVFELQTRIYRASERGDVKAVHRLQRLLMSSRAAKCLAVRRVTQDNRGKKTAGVDGVKSLTLSERFALTLSLTPLPKARPVRRVWIPKPGKTERRPLGIPTMRDRAAQTLVRLALEPEWEARFEPNSYGFRPGRSCHDAIKAIFNAIKHKAKYVLDADIAACFDRIDHAALLEKLSTFPALRRVIRRWLRAGVMESGQLFPTAEGTPQGGAISPLLANVALHGLEAHLRASFPNRFQGKEPWKPMVVRYADDFVVLHEDLGVVEQCQAVANTWLAGMGLELKPSKTRISHTFLEYQGDVGFDFLGFTVRQFPVGKNYSARNTYKKLLGFKTLIKPSATAQHRHLKEIADVIRRHRATPQGGLIELLNRKIIGWANYYSTEISKDVFSKMDHLVYLKLKRWAERRHPNKGKRWVAKRYWRTHRGRHWNFGRGEQMLAWYADTRIRRHIKVQRARSPFDGDLVYWASRLGRHPELPASKTRLLKRQQGRCAWCGLLFTNADELIEYDHTVPTALGGLDRQSNRQLLHGHCHIHKSAVDGSRRRWSVEVPMSRAAFGRGAG